MVGDTQLLLLLPFTPLTYQVVAAATGVRTAAIAANIKVENSLDFMIFSSGGVRRAIDHGNAAAFRVTCVRHVDEVPSSLRRAKFRHVERDDLNTGPTFHPPATVQFSSPPSKARDKSSALALHFG